LLEFNYLLWQLLLIEDRNLIMLMVILNPSILLHKPIKLGSARINLSCPVLATQLYGESYCWDIQLLRILIRTMRGCERNVWKSK
jgi:hypothetical protein